jgi:hypothetical protein
MISSASSEGEGTESMKMNQHTARRASAALMQALEPRVLLAVQPLKAVQVGSEALAVNDMLFFTVGDEL